MQPHFHTDQQAYKALLASDERALEYFFNLHYSALVYYARSISKNEMASEDIAIESFSKLWKGRDGLKQASQVKHFLYLVARNSSIDFLRAEKTQRKLASIVPSYPSLTEDPHLETVITTEAYDKLFRLISLLAPKAKQVFLMFHLHNKSVKHIARELSVSVNTVKEHKKRAMRFLRENAVRLNVLLLLSFFTL